MPLRGVAGGSASEQGCADSLGQVQITSSGVKKASRQLCRPAWGPCSSKDSAAASPSPPATGCASGGSCWPACCSLLPRAACWGGWVVAATARSSVLPAAEPSREDWGLPDWVPGLLLAWLPGPELARSPFSSRYSSVTWSAASGSGRRGALTGLLPGSAPWVGLFGGVVGLSRLLEARLPSRPVGCSSVSSSASCPEDACFRGLGRAASLRVGVLMVVPLLLSVSLWDPACCTAITGGPSGPSARAASGSSGPRLRLRCFLRSWSASFLACTTLSRVAWARHKQRAVHVRIIHLNACSRVTCLHPGSWQTRLTVCPVGMHGQCHGGCGSSQRIASAGCNTACGQPYQGSPAWTLYCALCGPGAHLSVRLWLPSQLA